MGHLEGLFVGGTVRDRRRRFINKAGSEQIEIVTYTLAGSNDRNFYVEDYAPSSYRNIGDQTCVPVYIKPYRKSNGQLPIRSVSRKTLKLAGKYSDFGFRYSSTVSKDSCFAVGLF